MRQADKMNVQFESIERIGCSVNGNPRFRVTLTDGSVHLTKSDAAINYEIQNAEFRGLVHLWLTRAGRIEYAVAAGRKAQS